MSETQPDLREALARCCDCQKVLQADEIEHYGDRCDACEWILQGQMEDNLPWPKPERGKPLKVISYGRFAELVAAEAQASALQAEVERLQKERDEAREVVALCNNSFGSYSYHTSPHPAEQIEKVKEQARSEWRRAEEALERLQKVEGEREKDAEQAARLTALLDAGDRLFAAERAVNDACDRGEEIHAANVAAAHAGQMPDLDASRQNYSEASMAGAIRFAAEQDLHNALAIACASRSARSSVTETKEGENVG